MILELTEEEATLAYNLLREEYYTVEEMVDKYHKIDNSSSDLDKKDAEGMKHQLDVMNSIIVKLSKK